MAHIHTGEGQHDATVSFLIVRKFDEDEQYRVLFHRHKRTGLVAACGGHIELDEHPWAAAMRELAEEAGYEPGQVYVLQPYGSLRTVEGATVHPLPVISWTAAYPGEPGHFHTDLLYALSTGEDPAHAPGEGESTELLWLTADELRAFDSDDIVTPFRDAALHILDRCWDWTYQSCPVSDFDY